MGLVPTGGVLPTGLPPVGTILAHFVPQALFISRCPSWAQSWAARTRGCLVPLAVLGRELVGEGLGVGEFGAIKPIFAP